MRTFHSFNWVHEWFLTLQFFIFWRRKRERKFPLDSGRDGYMRVVSSSFFVIFPMLVFPLLFPPRRVRAWCGVWRETASCMLRTEGSFNNFLSSFFLCHFSWLFFLFFRLPPHQMFTERGEEVKVHLFAVRVEETTTTLMEILLQDFFRIFFLSALLRWIEVSEQSKLSYSSQASDLGCNERRGGLALPCHHRKENCSHSCRARLLLPTRQKTSSFTERWLMMEVERKRRKI